MPIPPPPPRFDPFPLTDTASIWITEPVPAPGDTVAWVWSLDCTVHDPDPRARNRIAHDHAAQLRQTYPGCYVAVRPGRCKPPPIGGKRLPGRLHPLAVLGKTHPVGGLQGYCFTTYAALVALLGEPHHRGLDKIHIHWAFRCQNGTAFSVYDWKQRELPTGSAWWHIGGTGQALAAFERFTGLKTTRTTQLHPPAPAQAGE